MVAQLYNNTFDTLASSIDNVQTSFDVTSGDIPTVETGDYIPIYVIRSSDSAFEIMHVTSVSGSTLTVTRSAEAPGDSPLTFNSGDRVEIRPTRQSLIDMDVVKTGLDVENESTTNYTSSLDDANSKIKRLIDASGVTLTIPPESSVAFNIGDILTFEQGGAGQVDIQPGSGVTLSVVDNLTLKSLGQNSVFQGIKVASDSWVFYGSLESSQVGYLLGTKQIFDSAGEFTWTKPEGVGAVLVEVIGGGGGGRGPDTGAGGAGGGAGGYAKVFIDSSIGPTETVTVGAGGAGGAAGGNNGLAGAASSFGIHCAADGGGGGSNSGGAGGAGTTGNILAKGGPGQSRSYDGTSYLSGNGGNSFFAGGGLAPTGSTAGDTGEKGSGGSAGRDNAAGGDGGDGIVIVWEYY